MDKSTLKMLLAYLDGEFEGNDALDAKKRAMEELIQKRPNLRNDIVAFRKIKQLWQQSIPDEPAEQIYDEVWGGISNRCTETHANRRHSRYFLSRFKWSVLAAAAVVLVALGLYRTNFHQENISNTQNRLATAPKLNHVPPVVNSDKTDSNADSVLLLTEPFAVASARDVEILYVHGDDTDTLVVGNLPISGPLQLVEPGEVTLTKVQPAVEDNMIPNVDLVSDPPMIWAPVKQELDQP